MKGEDPTGNAQEIVKTNHRSAREKGRHEGAARCKSKHVFSFSLFALWHSEDVDEEEREYESNQAARRGNMFSS